MNLRRTAVPTNQFVSVEENVYDDPNSFIILSKYYTRCTVNSSTNKRQSSSHNNRQLFVHMSVIKNVYHHNAATRRHCLRSSFSNQLTYQ